MNPRFSPFRRPNNALPEELNQATGLVTPRRWARRRTIAGGNRARFDGAGGGGVGIWRGIF